MRPRLSARFRIIWCLWLLFCHAHGLRAGVPVEVFTNLFQFQQLARSDSPMEAGILLTGKVCEVSREGGFLVLQNNLAAEVFQLDSLPENVQVGQQVVLRSADCQVARRRTDVGLSGLPLISNDEPQGGTEQSAAVHLEAGLHPMRVEWFHQLEAAVLKVEYSGPGFSRQPIPDERLTHFDPVQGAPVGGLVCHGYVGDWHPIPDFGQLPVEWTESVSNFHLGVQAQAEDRGAVVGGDLRVTQPGNYTFYMEANAGSRLYLGEAGPTVEVLAAAPLSPPQIDGRFIGGITGLEEASRWLFFEGTVSFISWRAGRLELELRSPSNNRLQVDVLDSAGIVPEFLLNAKVRLTGVGRAVFSAGGQVISGLLTMVGSRDIEVLNLPPETWAAHPAMPISAACSASNLNLAVHVRGVLQKSPRPAFCELTGEGGEILIPAPSASELWVGQEVEALGLMQRPGKDWEMANAALIIADEHPPSQPLALLTEARQVKRLSRTEAARGYPVRLRGVITCAWPEHYRHAVLQDLSSGIFLLQREGEFLGRPKFGEFWEIEGTSGAGEFSPIVKVSSMRRLGEARMPEPVKPEWDQLINGSLDNQYVEFEGVVMGAGQETLTLLTHGGKIKIGTVGEKPPAIEQYANKLVRLRGCLLAHWDSQSRRVQVGEISLGDLSISTDQSFSADPFAVPARPVGELRLYDQQANAFRRVRISGQYLQQHGAEYFMVSGTNGLRLIPNNPPNLHPGDLIEVVGVPDLRGAAPVLREAVVRKTGAASLPAPVVLTAENLLEAANDSRRIQIEGWLGNSRQSGKEQILELLAEGRPFVARVPLAGKPPEDFVPGSRLRLTGVFAGQSAGRTGDALLDSFDLLLSSPRDIQVLSRPPWWTFARLVAALGILGALLTLVGLWVVQLRRQVEAQTRIIRKNVKHAAAMEERSRIARDLHDTLEQLLVGVNFQLGALADKLKEVPASTLQTLEQARFMVRHGQAEARRTVRNLRMFALERNNLAGALEQLAKEAFAAHDTKVELSVTGPTVALPVEVENHVLRICQEAMTNVVKHARANNLRVELDYQPAGVSLKITDDGCGFDVAATKAPAAGHFGLLGMRERTDKLGGRLEIISRPGAGTVITLQVPVAPGKQNGDL